MKIAVAFALCLLLFTMFAGDNGIQAVLRIQRDARSLAVEIAALKQENERLRISAEKLRDDPHTIEVVARETLGFARPDEIVVTRPRLRSVSYGGQAR
jgi:cell division protein FtsB